MQRDQQLADVLGEFARTMLTDFPIQSILDRLVERIVDVLPVTAAGVTLITGDAHPRFLAASNDAALHLERLQSALGQGPCVVANDTGTPVSVLDIRTDDRFPDFVAAAADSGLAAVFAFPMRHNNGRLGALDLFRDTPGPLDEWGMTAAQTLADVAAAYVLNAQAREDSAEAAELLRASTLHDPLTGLPNRVMLQQRLDHAAERARRSRAPAAVLFADLDGFKLVNDTHGHAVGDALLIAVARRLSALLRLGDTLARVSGDEFVILCEDLSSADAVDVLATRIADAFSRPFVVSADAPEGVGTNSVVVAVSASVGIAFAGHADEIGPQLIQDADRAMYDAKRRGGATHQVIDLTASARNADRLALRRDLGGALGRGQLALVYQPIVRAADGRVLGVETLLRWRHPRHGGLPVVSLIALAEQSSLILDIGQWVLERAMLDRAGWLRDHPDHPLGLSVNVSSRQLLAPGLRSTVARLLSSTGMDASALTLEFSERAFLEDRARVGVALAELRELGVHLALDDFGTGRSSLGSLRQFPVDLVKIDRGFVADIGVSSTGAPIVAAVIGLGHVLGLQVTAEGVESAAQHEKIAALGCDCAQGYHYARPMTAADLSRQLGAHPTGPLHLPEQREPTVRVGC
ncbi:MAG TPA: GGDEF domain-containing protein [Mycobacteriales bacterium]|nr:GGDEF domain-containing protein [Mycobacteriales bacterium]